MLENGGSRIFSLMSTLLAIKDAVSKLRGDEKNALSLWLDSQVEPELTKDEETELLASLDQAMRDIDSGKGSSMEDVRRQISSWASR